MKRKEEGQEINKFWKRKGGFHDDQKRPERSKEEQIQEGLDDYERDNNLQDEVDFQIYDEYEYYDLAIDDITQSSWEEDCLYPFLEHVRFKR